MLIPFEIMSEPRIKNRGLRHDAGASFDIGPNEGTQFYEEATLDGCIGCSGNVAGFLALWRFLHSVCQPDAFRHRNVCTIGRFSWRLLSFLAKRAMSPMAHNDKGRQLRRPINRNLFVRLSARSLNIAARKRHRSPLGRRESSTI